MIFFKKLFPLFFSVAIALLPGMEVKGQTAAGTGLEEVEEWASPGVIGERRSKGIQVSYNLVGAFNIESAPVVPGLEEGSARIRKLEEIEFSLRFPVSWRGRTTIAAGIDYLYEEYNFAEPAALTYDFYTNLENKHLNSLGGQVYVLHALSNRTFIGSRLGLELNGDYADNELPFRQQAKGSVAAMYGWKPNPYTVYAIGAYYSYTWGRPSVYPVVVWNQTFNKRWGVEAVLPQNIRLRRNFSQKSILLFGTRVSGRSYHIISDKPPLADYPYLELRNSNIFLFLEYEQEIYDFLWFGMTGGYRYNINFNVAEENSFSNSRIIENNVEASPYINISLFVVPPRSLLKKALAPSGTNAEELE
jgi:hypothetical protein